jgi:hypothetical protein
MIPAGFKNLTLSIASDHSNQLTAVTIEDMDQFYLIGHYL